MMGDSREAMGTRLRRSDEVDERRRAVVDKYARTGTHGRPVFCKPSVQEQAGVRLQAASADGKPIYDTVEAAEKAARELEALGARRMRAYECKRSKHGHFHLATI